jgi:hypothetical protein
MKRLALKITALLVAFAVGVTVVWIFNTLNFASNIDFTNESKIDFTNEQVSQEIPILKLNTKKLYPTSPDGKIEINFIEFSTSKDGLIAEFEVINRNTKPALYSAYSYKGIDELANLQPQFKINGIHEQLWYCGTGLEEFELKSGESKIIKLNGQSLNNYLNKANQSIQVGYWFSFRKSKQAKIFWSEKLQIPDSAKAQLKAEEIELKKKRQ